MGRNQTRKEGAHRGTSGRVGRAKGRAHWAHVGAHVAQTEDPFGMREDGHKTVHVYGHVYTLPLRMKPPSKMPKEALAFFREKGRVGGRTRAANLSASERSEQARNAVKARWARRTEDAQKKKGKK